ncbi:MAG TPA: hypothetical protein VGE12_02965 [Noviherbaspirillum sp.]
MDGLNRAWQVICRFVLQRGGHGDAGTEIAGSSVRTARSARLRRVRASAHGLKALWERIKRGMEDPQQRRERARRDAMWQERRAVRRSLTLLMKQMNAQQRHEFREYRYFYVTGGSSGDRYRIRIGTIANIDVMNTEGVVKHRLCARPADDVPVYDVMAAQLLHLQDAATEPRFLLHANVQPTLPEDRTAYRATFAS